MSAVIAMPVQDERKALVKQTFGKGLTDLQFELLYHTAEKYHLMVGRDIHGIPRKTKDAQGQWVNQMTMQISADGFRTIAERTGRYAPGRESTYAYDKNEKLLSATAYIKKQTIDGTWHDVSATAFFAEYCPVKQDGTPTGLWSKMPRVMLSKCAECNALRRAFPADLSGVYSHEEMAQAEKAPIEAQIVLPEVTDQTSEVFDSLIPEGCDTMLLAGYLQFCADHYDKTVANIKAMGVSAPDKFFNAFAKWAEKQNKIVAVDDDVFEQ